jgi:uncharacterized membrane protein
VQGNPLLCGWSTKRECPGDPPLPLTVDVKNATQSKLSLFVLLLLMLYNIMFSHSKNTHELPLPILSFGVSSACHVFYNTTMHVYVTIDVISAHVDGCHLAFETL